MPLQKLRRYKLNAYYRETTEDDLIVLAPILRDCDKAEMEASTGSNDFLMILRMSLQASNECFTIINPKGEIAGVFGVSSSSTAGVPWMLCAAGIETFAKTLIKQNKKIIKQWLSHYGLLFNYVDCRNTTAINWLRFLGFTMIRELTLADPNVPFYEFAKVE